MSHNGNGSRHCYSFEEFRLYPEERLLLRGVERIPLTPRVLDMLIVLVARRGELVSKEALLESVWMGSFVEEGNINKTVSTLRKNLGSQANGSDYIETVPKTGYRFIAPVQESVEEPEPELLQLPWSTVRRPVFWASAITGLAMLVILASSYMLNPRSVKSEDGSVNASQNSSGHNFPGSGAYEPVRLTYDPGRYAYPMWTEDGRIRYEYYGRKKEGEAYVMDANGANQTPVDSIPDLRHGTWSPDGKRLYFWRRNDPAVYLADADGKNEKKLPFNPGNISWSPDGTRIVFQSLVLRGKTQDWEISTYDLTTEKMVNLTNNAALDADPSWSPDGNEIVFNSDRDGDFEIYLMNSDGSSVRRLTRHPAWDSHPVFSPDGTQIAFNSNRENENYDVYVMNTNGSGITKLTNWESHEEVAPGCWSPDGTKIAFVSNRSGNEDIYVMSVEPFRPLLVLADPNANVGAASYSPDGKQIVYQAELADNTGELRIQDVENDQDRLLLKTANGNLRPSWSPDGKRIAFQNRVAGMTALFLIDPDGSNLTKLTNDSTSDGPPSWSPDGTQITYIEDNYGRTRLFTINIGTLERRPLTPQEGWEAGPAWSPDGKQIAFSCDRQDSPGNGLDICLIDTDGNNESRLLSRRGHDTQPAWSPDGSRLAFVSSSDGNDEIYVVSADGTGLLRVTRNKETDTMPHWSSDGKRVIFTCNRSGKYAVYEIAL